MNNPKRLIAVLVIVLAAATIIVLLIKSRNNPTASNTPRDNSSSDTQTPAPAPASMTPAGQVVPPIANAGTRVTKKPFGIYITPASSPVQPERFTGYHTGTDFETTPAEQNIEVPFYAICAGKILTKRTASGYGGVFVQSCTINSQAVTIIYGHVSIKSIAKNVGDSLTQGEKIGNLGASPSETDGERKHLHLGIHLSAAVNILGYVQQQSELAGWLDYQKL